MSAHYCRTHAEFAERLHVSVQELAEKLPCYSAHCDGHFILRVNRVDGGVFFGCSRYPDCRATRSADSVDDEVTHTICGVSGDPDDPAWELAR